jgi:hypothetical protein
MFVTFLEPPELTRAALLILMFMGEKDLRGYCGGNTARASRRGRSELRMACRDEKMVFRFYYYAVIKQCTYGQTIRNLSNEFDIVETVITARLKKISGKVDEVFDQKPTLKYLRDKFPYYTW